MAAPVSAIDCAARCPQRHRLEQDVIAERARCAAVARKFNCEHVAQEIEAVSE